MPIQLRSQDKNSDISYYWNKIYNEAFDQVLYKHNPQILKNQYKTIDSSKSYSKWIQKSNQKMFRYFLKSMERRNMSYSLSDILETIKVKDQQKTSTNQEQNQIINHFNTIQFYYHNLIQNQQIKNVTDIKIISQLIAQQDASYIKEFFHSIKNKIKPLFQTVEIWERNKYYYAYQLNNLMRLLNHEIEQYSNFKKIFPEWLSLKRSYMKVTKIARLAQVLYSQYPQSESRLKAKRRNKILVQYQKKYKMVDPIIMGQQGPQPISRYIVKNFPKTKGWKQIFMALQRDLRIEEQQLQFMKNIHNERHLPKDYLCCSQFYYQGFDLFNQWIDSYNDIDTIDSSQKVTQVQIKQKVVSMLNGRGGLIFFDAFKNLTETICEGIVISQKAKQQTTQKLMAYLQGISPAIEINKHYSFQWVPIIQNPTRYFSQQKLPNQTYRKRNYRKGRFILRMKIFSSTQPQTTYHFQLNQTSYFFKRNQENYRVQQLKGHQIYYFMKERFFQNQKAQYQHKHQFYPKAEPDIGQRAYPNSDPNPNPNPSPKPNPYPNHFKFHSLIVVDKTNINKVAQALNQQKVDHLIQQSFPEYGLRLSLTTWILHHNLKFDKIKSYLANKNLRYANNSKQVMLISTTKSLQTIYLDQGGISNLQAWLKGRFPEQKLTYEKKQNEYYISAQTTMASIFLYMLLDNFQIKAMFKKIPDNASNRIPTVRN